ncbi:hypothetical protein DQ04_00291030 [Trypanosoma grayi]|uniref:hypothetical protein n=1 Tax=Trypanosoma grayi TaxID=71804 RepID=UPI0004F43EC8|nr:hypothetical protein DQ04_00291030 [Trypanosoma grayi]KEG14817.1 hypothetical protein DQ04_00291030 [Trypanosoma grayi]
MTASAVLLADGSEGFLSHGETYCSLACVDGNIWALRSCEEYVDVLDARGCDVLDTVSLPEVCVSICCVGQRVWLLTLKGQILICEPSGVFLGVLDAQVGSIEYFHILWSCPLFLATSQKCAFHIWDVARTEVRQTFSCEGGDIIEVFPIHLKNVWMCVQTDRISLWNAGNSSPIYVEPVENATAAVFLGSLGRASPADCCWVGGAEWITVFRVVENSTEGVVSLQKERLIPCAKVRQLAAPSFSRVVSLDAEALVTVWDSHKFTPVRLFKIDSAMGLERGVSGSVVFSARTSRIATLWTLCGGKCLVWEDREDEDAVLWVDASEDCRRDLMQEEILYLRKKNLCLLEMMDAYREKVLEIVSITSGDRERTTANVVTLNKCLGDQLVMLRRDDKKPQRVRFSEKCVEQVKFWREKYAAEMERNVILLNDLRLLADRLKSKCRDSEFDVRVADLLTSNCASQRRESELRRRLLLLETRLYEMGTTVPSSMNALDGIDVDKENCCARVVELQKELQRALEVGEGSVTAQQDIQKITEALNVAQKALQLEREKTVSLARHASVMKSENEKLFGAVEYLQEELKNTQRENSERAELLTRHKVEAEEAARRSSLAVAEGVEEIRLLRNQVEQVEDNRHLVSVISLRDTEISGLKRQLDILKSMLSTRQKESAGASSAYDSIVDLLQSVKHDSQATRLVRTLGEIENRLEHLKVSEQLLRQKDDLIAVRDDELRVLRSRLGAVEETVSRVSSLFYHVPYTVEDVEAQLLELNEYRQRYGRSEKIDEAVAMQLLELASARPSARHGNMRES